MPKIPDPPKLDRRQLRTKQLLQQALLALIETKGLDSITVTDVANHANVNRGTFYLHYKDVADLLEQMQEEVFQRIQSVVFRLDPIELSGYANKDEPYPKIIAIFEEVLRHADFFKVMLGPRGDISCILRFRELMTTHIFNKFNHLIPHDDKLLVPREYLIAYMSSANFGMFLHWVATGMQETPYEMARIATQIVNHGPIVSAGIRGKGAAAKHGK
ncbi:TetR/AcrR family transcriptional regulator [Paenibacillus sp. GCM10027626]|uniref:TetR/AcrR family transcriptional regulator n=1 Tax=Paenibacillus sp. GCM10027626 TaxID=3273411 RepID=UPI00363C4B5D